MIHKQQFWDDLMDRLFSFLAVLWFMITPIHYTWWLLSEKYADKIAQRYGEGFYPDMMGKWLQFVYVLFVMLFFIFAAVAVKVVEG